MLQLDEKPDTSLETYKGGWKNWIHSKTIGLFPGGQTSDYESAVKRAVWWLDWAKAAGSYTDSEGVTRPYSDLTGIHMQIPVGDA